MTCTEFERALADIIDDESCRTVEHHQHIETCSSCESLVNDLNAISEEARFLEREAEPSARVWNSIEMALRQEGLIRGRRRVFTIFEQKRHWWRAAWLVPVAATLLVIFGVRYELTAPKEASKNISLAANDVTSDDDQQLLQTVQRRSPAMLASYEDNLRNVNSYIRDAEESAKSNPNDEEAQRILMNAYEQKAMVYEMAVDRSLP
ncbi:MAG: hypothetical protein JWO91_2411 [Acidobacteriaceae bacterium]|nr:hypothetical protein [Acidobacteriaceae bacterium]